MCRWLRGGNVIYKSVGMGLMDLVVGSDLVTLARSNGVGVTVEDF
jgi:ornithine cyclodeaminase/alanine dehydrogenase-like protein (mu-crystallin family)